MEQSELETRILNSQRLTRLHWYEEQITVKAKELALIFRQLRDDSLKPWLATHPSIEEYCVDRWKMSRRRLAQISAGETLRALLADEADGDEPVVRAIEKMPERQLRELAKAPARQRLEIVKTVIAPAVPRSVTAETIRKATGSAPVPRRPRPVVLDSETGHPVAAPQQCPHCGQAMP